MSENMRPSVTDAPKSAVRSVRQAKSGSLVTTPLSGNVRRQAVFWLGTLAFFILCLIIFSDILFPFVAGLAMAYFLNPIVEFLEKIHFPISSF